MGQFHAKYADEKITGTIGALAKAKTLEVIKALEPLLYELKKKDVWMSEKQTGNILKQTEEQ